MTDLMNVIRAQWDRALAALLTVLGLLFLVFGWIGISGAEAVVKQLPYIISGGLGGIALVAVGAALWVSSDMRDEWSEVRRLRLTVERLEGSAPGARPNPMEVLDGLAPAESERSTTRDAVAAATRVGRESPSQAW